MQLDDFLAETLTQIVRGVEEARSRTGVPGVGAQPSNFSTTNHTNNDIVATDGAVAQVVRFDVALTVAETSDSSAKIGVMSGIFNGKGAMSDQNQSSTVSRVQFSIPVVLPKPVR